ncbi:hypothetical protein TraAM80_06054 [Trypanosoma rangeli]|uniref:Uncharacterized protein n=1 Tax=Trypanosoma rangeli TaxID=5698 RepID=A0A3S5IQX8_TRYRA|nr:uncharacterized protein TraAM80_06054 [Trypanosoma rangeli]RNF03048.1 hypothetical protein TraAM80_06054 [Trypanosoma rangeli]|eukprot:RNF03048.1 hypothetical protein TraAM80_06054 [Trypanosoma rangeli]
MSVVISEVSRRCVQHNPYDKQLLDTRSDGMSLAAVEFFNAAAQMEEDALTSQKEVETMDAYDHMTCTEGEGGMSDNVTDEASQTLAALQMSSSAFVMQPAPVLPAVRYASVNFRFGSAWFVAPFRTSVGEMVVVEYPHNKSLHMGLVSCISTRTPPTFAAMTAADGTISEADLRLCPTLVRHARDFDRRTKLELRSHDLASLKNAQTLALEMEAPVTFLDAEWLLDLTAVTFLVNVWGNMSLVDRLADELAVFEGSEVVFTYPAVN